MWSNLISAMYLLYQCIYHASFFLIVGLASCLGFFTILSIEDVLVILVGANLEKSVAEIYNKNAFISTMSFSGLSVIQGKSQNLSLSAVKNSGRRPGIILHIELQISSCNPNDNEAKLVNFCQSSLKYYDGECKAGAAAPLLLSRLI